MFDRVTPLQRQMAIAFVLGVLSVAVVVAII
jgi:hypothetical protein